MKQAGPEDIPFLVAEGRKFHAASGHPCPFEADATVAFLSKMLTADNPGVFVTDNGGIGGMLCPAYCGPSWLMAIELFWWASKDGLALLRRFEEWAADMGANEVRMTTLSVLPRADAILRRKGYSPCEISYTKVL